MATKLVLTRRGKTFVKIMDFIAGVGLYGGLIFGAAVLEKIVQ